MSKMNPNTRDKRELSYWFEQKVNLNKKKSTIYGIGIDDSGYTSEIKVEGKLIICPVYQLWRSIIQRCYSEKFHRTNPTYRGTTVCREWLTFSNFKCWWVNNYKDGYQLDKDLLVLGNKTYSPETCIFIPQWLNSFVTDNSSARGKYLIGCNFDKSNNKFKSRCCDPRTKKQHHIGYFDTELDAHLAWLHRKLDILCELKSEIDKIDHRLYDCVVLNIKMKTIITNKISSNLATLGASKPELARAEGTLGVLK